MRRVRTAAGLPRRWATLLAQRPAGSAPQLFYGHAHLPQPHETLQGGFSKLRRLERAFPNVPRGFNVLYLGSNTLPIDFRLLLALARRRGVPLVWNQDGVAYPAWYGRGWERANAPLALGLAEARHVVYQSVFCKESSDRFAGEPAGRWEVLHNGVDTSVFVPRTARPKGPPTLLLGGTQSRRYRVETALRTVALLPEVRLLVAGRLAWSRSAAAEARSLAAELGVDARVEWTGPYAQADAPALMRRADVLLHTKVMDPCPNVVVEALASGLPVVYAASGGTPELVGAEAGVGVPSRADWEHDVPPAPEELAAAVGAVLARLGEYAQGARTRAVERLDVVPWLERHRAIFEEVLL